MAFGGYGPPHSLVLWDEAVALSPEIVVEAFYLGNDLFDAFDPVYDKGQLPELKSADPAVQDRIRAAERSGSLAERVNELLYMGKLPSEAEDELARDDASKPSSRANTASPPSISPIPASPRDSRSRSRRSSA
jgi:hypothetical protein